MVASSWSRSTCAGPSHPGRVVTGSDVPVPLLAQPADAAGSASGPSSLTTRLSSADAMSATLDWDPGTDHGYHGELSAVLIPAQELQAKIAELAHAVAADHTVHSPPLLVCVLKGAVMFVTDFARALPIPSELEFMAVTSYGSATSSSGVVRILKDLDRDITGRRVIIVEDIIDSGLTLSWLLRNLATRGPASIEVVALLRKPEAIKVEVDVRYVGFDIPTDFVVGYGLDYNERYRDLPFVGLLGEHMYR
jgi:hypoxanthine phosphoribosyltransferase